MKKQNPVVTVLGAIAIINMALRYVGKAFPQLDILWWGIRLNTLVALVLVVGVAKEQAGTGHRFAQHPLLVHVIVSFFYALIVFAAFLKLTLALKIGAGIGLAVICLGLLYMMEGRRMQRN